MWKSALATCSNRFEIPASPLDAVNICLTDHGGNMGRPMAIQYDVRDWIETVRVNDTNAGIGLNMAF